MAQLGEQEHNAIVLRFYEGKGMKQVGAALGTGEDAARMRINRALDKLRRYFASRGVTLSAAVMTAAVATHAVHAAPVGLASAVAAASLAQAAGGASSGGLAFLKTLALKKNRRRVAGRRNRHRGVCARIDYPFNPSSGYLKISSGWPGAALFVRSR